jgi:PAS domain S-box-containing protein
MAIEAMFQCQLERVRERDEIWRVSQDMLLVIDRQGILRTVNPTWTRTLGCQPKELIGSREPL